MKKPTLALALVAGLILPLAACASGDPSTGGPSSEPAPSTPSGVAEEPKTVTVTGSNGETASLTQNPKRVAIYDYAILDILNSIGFDKTGIEQLAVPAKDTLPDGLSYYKNQGDDKVVTGGTLFYLDWDVLDLIQPELVILGARSFGSTASGDSLSPEDKEKYIADTHSRYQATAFVTLSVNARNSQLSQDIKANVAALGEIFPAIKAELKAKLDQLMGEVKTLGDKAQQSGKTALFAMMVDQTTLAVFNPDSRFDMLYEDFGFTPVDNEATAWTDAHGFDVRAEYVLEKNPDVIFLLDRSALVGSGPGADNFKNDPVIAQTKAAQAGDIYLLDTASWYTMTGGFSALETMLKDLRQYLDKIS